MPRKKKSTQLFHHYFEEWANLYKVGAIRNITLQKYRMSQKQITKLVPDLVMSELSRRTYQNLLNKYAEIHEKQTTMDFHHHLKGAILDAVDEGIIK